MKNVMTIMIGLLIMLSIPTAWSHSTLVVGKDGVVENDSALCGVDSVELDSMAFVDMFMPAEQPDTIRRYTIYSTNGKFGVFDKWKNTNVTLAEFSELRYAQRSITGGAIYTYFSMKRENEIGTVCVNETNNDYTIQILASFP